MGDLENIPVITKESGKSDQRTPPLVMLSTLLLLIAGFLLTSIMLLYYAFETTLEGSGPIFNLEQIIAKTKTLEPDSFQAGQPEQEPVIDVQSDQGLHKPITVRRQSKVRWPKLKLAGFGKSSTEATSFAIINGRQVHLGQTINGVTLAEIHDHNIVVEYKGERKTLTVDRTN